MIKDKGIWIKNIYYMLSYAFQVLRQSDFEEVAAEEFDQTADLFAAILAKGIARQVKQGLYREYAVRQEDLPALKGKLNLFGTIQNHWQGKPQLACEFDELSENNQWNQILKTAVGILLKEPAVKQNHKAELKKVLLYLDGVDRIDPAKIRWDQLHFQRNNQNYRMLIHICYFVLDGLLPTAEQGRYKIASFTEKHMEQLFERFVLEYFRRHHPYLDEVKRAQIPWNLDDGADESMIRFLPVMQTDMTLRYKEQVLIVDTKYYSHTMQSQYGNHKLHSGHLYQIFTYVKNRDAENAGRVSGLLLYAKTEEAVAPDCEFSFGGNRISARTLDLNRDFREIAGQLDQIARAYFGEQELREPFGP